MEGELIEGSLDSSRHNMTWRECLAEIRRLTGLSYDALDDRCSESVSYLIEDSQGETWGPSREAFGESPYRVIQNHDCLILWVPVGDEGWFAYIGDQQVATVMKYFSNPLMATWRLRDGSEKDHDPNPLDAAISECEEAILRKINFWGPLWDLKRQIDDEEKCERL